MHNETPIWDSTLTAAFKWMSAADPCVEPGNHIGVRIGTTLELLVARILLVGVLKVFQVQARYFLGPYLFMLSLHLIVLSMPNGVLPWISKIWANFEASGAISSMLVNLNYSHRVMVPA